MEIEMIITLEQFELHRKWRNDEVGGVRLVLSGAVLRGADLRGAKNIACAGPLGSRGDFAYANSGHDTADGLMWKAGCRCCCTAELYAAIQHDYGDGQYAMEYRAAMASIGMRLGVSALAAEAGKGRTL